MAVVYSQYGWVPVTGGAARVPIFKGVFIHGAPVQWVQFARTVAGLPSIPITFTVTMYSAAAPWYFTSTGPATAWRNFAVPVPAGAFTPLPRVDIGKAPWDAGFPIWALAAPWAEFYVTTNISCMANLFVL
jgi:hypothetical protein